MVKRCVYSSVSTHTLIPSPSLLLYPVCGASHVTHMLALNINKDTALGCAVPMGSSVIPAPAVAFQHPKRHTGLVFNCPVRRVSLQVGLWLGFCFGISKQVSKQA